MGQPVSTPVMPLADKADALDRYDKDTDDFKEMAEAPFDGFREQVRTADTATKSLPTTKVLTEFLFYQANVKSDATALKDRVRELITGPDGHLELVSGDEWADAVSGAVAVAVGDMMADLESASTVERQLCLVSKGPSEGIERLDAVFILQAYQDIKMRTLVRDLLACLVIRSEVDMETVDEGTMRLVVDDSYPSATDGEKLALYEELVAMMPKRLTDGGLDGDDRSHSRNH